MLVWLYVHNYVYTICCILCSWVIADLNRQNNHCWMCFTCCWSLLFWHLSSFSCFYRWFVKPSCANFTFDGIFCCCWLWKIWYLCGNDKWLCVNSWCSMFNWWMWWGVMNGCHENPRRKKWHTNSNTQTHLSTFEVFVLLQCWWCVINTLKIDTEQLQHINVFTGGVQKNTSQLAHNWLVSVNISYCCLSWSLTVTPSQCTLQMHTHCYKSHIPHIRAFSYLN